MLAIGLIAILFLLFVGTGYGRAWGYNTVIGLLLFGVLVLALMGRI
jgi:hypothetical protein